MKKISKEKKEVLLGFFMVVIIILALKTPPIAQEEQQEQAQQPTQEMALTGEGTVDYYIKGQEEKAGTIVLDYNDPIKVNSEDLKDVTELNFHSVEETKELGGY